MPRHRICVASCTGLGSLACGPVIAPLLLLLLPLLPELETGDGVCTDKSEFTRRFITTAVPEPPEISKSDAEFLAMGLEFIDVREGIKITELNELFEKVTQAHTKTLHFSQYNTAVYHCCLCYV